MSISIPGMLQKYFFGVYYHKKKSISYLNCLDFLQDESFYYASLESKSIEYIWKIKYSRAFSYEENAKKMLILVIFPHSINLTFAENYLNL